MCPCSHRGEHHRAVTTNQGWGSVTRAAHWGPSWGQGFALWGDAPPEHMCSWLLPLPQPSPPRSAHLVRAEQLPVRVG